MYIEPSGTLRLTDWNPFPNREDRGAQTNSIRGDRVIWSNLQGTALGTVQQ